MLCVCIAARAVHIKSTTLIVVELLSNHSLTAGMALPQIIAMYIELPVIMPLEYSTG